MNTARDRFLYFVAPSFMSGLVTGLIAVIITVTVLTPYLYRGSYLEQYGEVLRRYPGGWTDTFRSISNQLNSNELVANISLFCAWAVVGLAVYYLFLMFLSMMSAVLNFRSLLEIRGANRREIIIGATERLAVRVGGLIGLALFAHVSFAFLVPVILTLIAASFTAPWVWGVLYIGAAVAFLLAALHVAVLLLRLIFLRPRVILWMYQTSDAA